MTALAPPADGPWCSEDDLWGTDAVYREVFAQLAGEAPRHRLGAFLGSSRSAFGLLISPKPTDLYIASEDTSATEVLRRTLEWALARGMPFVFANSPDALRWLNSRAADPSCAGRFIALRPDNLDASELRALTTKLKPFQGPLLPDATPLMPGSIAYRAVAGGVPLPLESAASELGVSISERILENVAGAVFSGIDRATGQQVIVKFSRRGVRTSPSDVVDAASLRRHDHALRADLDGKYGCPRALALHELPEGVVTVENCVDGVPLAALIDRRNPLYHDHPDGSPNAVAYARLICRTMAALLDLLTELHAGGVVHGDLTPGNVLLQIEANGTVRPVLVDFELASSAGRPRLTHGRTPGFSPSGTSRTQQDVIASDLFGFGRVVLSSFIMAQNLGEINVDVMLRVFQGVADTFGIPEWAADEMARLLRLQEPSEDDRAAWSTVLRELLDHLSHVRQSRVGRRADGRFPAHEDIAAQIAASADVSSPVCLFPGTPQSYSGLGASLGYGSAGVLASLARCGVDIRPEWVDWTIEHAHMVGDGDEGLRDGAIGLLWAMSDLVDSHQMDNLLARTAPLSSSRSVPPALEAEFAALHLKLAADGFEGAADLNLARRICDDLCHSDQVGISGAATLLLAYQSFKDPSHLRAGLRHAKTILTTLPRPDAGRRKVSLLTGTAGALAVGIRYAALDSDEQMLQQCHAIAVAAAAAHPLLTGVDNGLAGLGLALLDCRDITGDAKYDRLVSAVAQRLSEMTVPTANGPAFPGPRLTRLSNDYATGTAGVLAFYHRLAVGRAAASQTHPILAAADALATV